jgi:hypothetical protein
MTNRTSGFSLFHSNFIHQFLLRNMSLLMGVHGCNFVQFNLHHLIAILSTLYWRLKLAHSNWRPIVAVPAFVTPLFINLRSLRSRGT